MYILNYKSHFDAAHHLIGYKGKCANIHGHRWNVEIEIVTHELKEDMVIDFNLLKEIVDELDHKDLNQIFTFNPTCEKIADYLLNRIKEECGDSVKVTLYESPNSSITVQ
jgi:6-pyruvoyltetrahydropterin/6-carboxytetrahydropterin synthase